MPVLLPLRVHGELDRKRYGRSRTSERAELIGYFTNRLNATRDGKKYKKLSYRALAVKLSQIKSLSDLYVLKSVCEDAERRGKPFSAILLVVHQTAK